MFDHFTVPPREPHRPLARLLDVTLRDGGFEVDFRWPEQTFERVTRTLTPCGVDVVEVGYIGGLPKEHGRLDPGLGAHVTPELVASARRPGLTLAAMVHPSALTTPLDLRAYAKAGLGMIRFVYHPDWAETITAVALRASGHGMAVTVNIALASRYGVEDLLEHAARICDDVGPDVLYVADTCGALTPDHVSRLIRQLGLTVAASSAPTEIGFHAHDFLTLAYANSLAAVQAGATYLDCSLLGLGRGSGNLSSELMLVRHRLRGADTGRRDLAQLLACRQNLAALAGRPAPSLVPMVCGTLNLTPVEEDALLSFAAQECLDADVVALWAAGAIDDIASLMPAGILQAWQSMEGPR